MKVAAETKTGRIELRITPEARQLLQEAARERHTTMSQFILESALRSAGTVLVERTRVSLDAEQWEAFLAALDAQPRRHPRMERLLNEPTIVE